MEALVPDLYRCIIRAGRAILEIYDTDFAVDTKSDDSPITEADRRANAIIEEGLGGISLPECNSGLPILSEEGARLPYPVRATWRKYWLVDPLDGTKEFVNRNGEFTVNIALIDEGRPAVGFVYVPVPDVLYYGIRGMGSFRLENASKTAAEEVLRRSVSLPLPDRGEPGFRVVASRSHLNKETEDFIRTVEKRLRRSAETVQAGSSLKFCRVAEGAARLYPRFGPTMEWDTAAAHAVCNAAGCRVIDVSTGSEMRYNKENLLNNHFIAGRAEDLTDIL